jgi:hypothetical protein
VDAVEAQITQHHQCLVVVGVDLQRLAQVRIDLLRSLTVVCRVMLVCNVSVFSWERNKGKKCLVSLSFVLYTLASCRCANAIVGCAHGRGKSESHRLQ